MAENVNITGIPQGVLKDALEGIPPWATEATAHQIEVLLTKSLKVHEASLKALVDGLANRTTDFDTSVADFLRTLDQAGDALDQRVDQEERDRQRQRDFDEQENARRNQAVNATLAAALAFSQTINSALASNVATYRDLDQSGVNITSGFKDVDSGFQALSAVTRLTGVRFTELSASLKKYSTAVNVTGLAAFANIVGDSRKKMQEFGYTQVEAADILGAYLETERLRGDFNQRTQDQTQRQYLSFSKSIMGLSHTMGMSTDQLLENIKAQSASTDSAVNSIRLGQDATDKMNAFIGSFKDQNIGRQLSALMTASIKPLNSTFMNLQKVGGGAMASSLTRFTESLKGVDPAVAQGMMADWVKANGQAIDQQILQTQFLKEAGVEGAAESLELLRGLKEQAASYAKLSPEEKQARERSSKSAAQLSNSFENLKSSMLAFISPFASILDGISSALNVVSDVIYGIGDLLGPKISSSIGVFVGSISVVVAGTLALAKAMTILRGTTALFNAGLFRTLRNMFMSTVTGRPAGQLAGSLGGAAGSISRTTTGGVAGNAAGQAAGTVAGPNAGGFGKFLTSLGKGLGSLISSLGKGAGAAISGIMRGISMGLMAFANPAVLVGATIFAASLAIISAGLAAASWIIGKALPTLAEGFESFNAIDGDNLISVGAGIAALGGGLVAFAAGNAISSVGGLVAGLTGSLNSLLGIETPLDKIKSMAELGPGLALFNSGLAGVTAGISSFSASLGSIPGTSKLESVIKTINSLSLAKSMALSALLMAGGTGTALANSVINGNSNKPIGSSLPVVARQPVQSTIDVNTGKPKSTNTSDAASAKSETTAVEDAATMQQAASTDINNIISSQNITLARLLENAESQLSVNKEMLQYIRNQ